MIDFNPSHVTRFSMGASSYDVVCINCGATDEVPGGWGRLVLPCPKPVEQGGMTLEEYQERERSRVEEFLESTAKLGEVELPLPSAAPLNTQRAPRE